ncbi:uncharacterized protein BYT42DRAFT_580018 [Radiomyces spectabilis]|uniref:uncharacterized protein n=1 Tax=Radiomyces spectabilis TaxID=64574 RepID=UPI00221E6B44|nr:uncharacterized protein BYT42DRAFT_580018 [Radiomyces spectabilis]KAI8371374.1 hypothetical protein BYT42DRAFT_580018 [Radiomyces spectabilis]
MWDFFSLWRLRLRFHCLSLTSHIMPERATTGMAASRMNKPRNTVSYIYVIFEPTIPWLSIMVREMFSSKGENKCMLTKRSFCLTFCLAHTAHMAFFFSFQSNRDIFGALGQMRR